MVCVREPRRDRAEDPDVPPDGNADADAARSVHAGERTLRRPMRRAFVFPIVLVVLTACTVHQVAVAAGWLAIGRESGDDPTGTTAVVIAALVALIGGAIALGTRLRSRLAPLVPLAAVAFVVARFYTFDSYYAPAHRRMSDGGLVAPGLIYVLIAAAVAVAALLAKRPRAAPAGSALLVALAFVALIESAGH